ncbi:MAG: hypothetical protein ABI441_10830 [Flavobacterium sp.]
MKKLLVLLPFMLLTSCQVTETINLNPDGSGTIEVVNLREENSYMQLAGENYSKEERFRDTTYVFQEYITKYAENFAKLPASEKAVFNPYKNVKVHIKESSFEKEFKTTFTQDFNKVEAIADLYKTEEYADDIRHNYALTAENHYYRINYAFNGTVFNRLVSVTSQSEFEKAKEQLKKMEANYGALKLTQVYTLNYHFPRKIKSVSSPKAILSSDKKTVTVEFKISDCLLNPESTSLEVVLE